MNEKNIIFGSVIYEDAIPFLNDFFESLISQEYKDFEVLLINDNIPRIKCEELINEYIGKLTISVHHNQKNRSPGELKLLLIEKAISLRAELLLLGDCDDRFSADRVKYYVEESDDFHTFFYNELLDFDGNIIMPKLPEETKSINDILQKNYLGFSNTGINLKLIDVNVLRWLNDNSSNFIDWDFYSCILAKGGRGKFVNGAKTYYRVHNNNVLGIRKGTKENIDFEIKVKSRHYSLLKLLDKKFFLLADLYVNKKEEVEIVPTQNTSFWWGLTKKGGERNDQI